VSERWAVRLRRRGPHDRHRLSEHCEIDVGLERPVVVLSPSA
jgi:hypothetical protein